MKVGLFTSSAPSIMEQARLFNTFNLPTHALEPSAAPIINNAIVLKPYEYAVFFIDPFFYIVPKFKDAVLYFTVDGIPDSTPILITSYRNLCRMYHCYANSQYSKANLEAVNIHVEGIVHNAVDTTTPSPNVTPVFDTSMLGYYNFSGVKWYMDRKGLHLASFILAKLANMGFRFHILVASDDGYFNYVAPKIRDMVTYGNVIGDKPFNLIRIGGLPKFEVYRIYKSARFYIMPSLTEGFGLGVLEAMYNGVPALVNPYQTTSELLKDAPSGCIRLVKAHSTKQYRWGTRDLGLLMTFVYPDINDFIDGFLYMLEHAKHTPTCSEWVTEHYSPSSYDPIRKLVAEWLRVG